MDSTVCGKCGYRVTPIRVFGRSPKTGKQWTIIKCPRESCGFNIDILEGYGKDPKNKQDRQDGSRGWFS